jgi:hypothetical protein
MRYSNQALRNPQPVGSLLAVLRRQRRLRSPKHFSWGGKDWVSSIARVLRHKPQGMAYKPPEAA